ncbi:hypothetical protein LX36DRAFT_100223 [Colletotrichum falcatum]|nr:hypothetical protein LX36DRAFT_100223 [Colletotrichum falcatum]
MQPLKTEASPMAGRCSWNPFLSFPIPLASCSPPRRKSKVSQLIDSRKEDTESALLGQGLTHAAKSRRLIIVHWQFKPQPTFMCFKTSLIIIVPKIYLKTFDQKVALSDPMPSQPWFRPGRGGAGGGTMFKCRRHELHSPWVLYGSLARYLLLGISSI